MSLDNTIKYLTQFFQSKYPDYQEMMRDIGSSHSPPAFDGKNEIIQYVRNIVHNMSDNFSDVTIPQGYASPSLLLDALHGLRKMADQQLQEVEQIENNLGNQRFNCITDARKINLEVREAIDHALSLTASTVSHKIVPIERLKKLAEKLPIIAHQLQQRRKSNGTPRPTITIADEYDVQDLLHAILKIDFEDVRPEEWCPSHAGSSKRTDFLLKNERIVVEVKKTRQGLRQKEVGDELTIDIANYRKHQDCEQLVCIVWDTDRLIINPKGLSSDLEKSNEGFVYVFIIQ
jgi:hypothetical protein